MIMSEFIRKIEFKFLVNKLITVYNLKMKITNKILTDIIIYKLLKFSRKRSIFIQIKR